MATATVKWFNDDKGYGYLAPDEGGADLFVHYTAIEDPGPRSLERGERVSYVPTSSTYGDVARYVCRIESAYKR